MCTRKNKAGRFLGSSWYEVVLVVCIYVDYSLQRRVRIIFPNVSHRTAHFLAEVRRTNPHPSPAQRQPHGPSRSVRDCLSSPPCHCCCRSSSPPRSSSRDCHVTSPAARAPSSYLAREERENLQRRSTRARPLPEFSSQVHRGTQQQPLYGGVWIRCAGTCAGGLRVCDPGAGRGGGAHLNFFFAASARGGRESISVKCNT